MRHRRCRADAARQSTSVPNRGDRRARPVRRPGTGGTDRARGSQLLLAPVLTTVVAFLVGGLVVGLTGKNPFRVYSAIFTGTGLNWFFHVGNYSARVPFSTQKVWFPWDTASVAAGNLQQTLLLTTPIILTGLAVAFAFRCGMFNIGGQGQYLVGSYVAVWLGSSFAALSPFLHVTVCLVVGALAGGVYAGIAGILKATVGAHEVITTIMLNWIAVWVGSYLFGQGGPLQNSAQASIPVSNDIVEGAKLPVFWGAAAAAGALDRDLHRARDARRLLGDHQPNDARLRGAGRRVQPRGGALRRHLGRAEHLRRDGDRRCARRPGRRARRDRVGVPDRPIRHHASARSASSGSPRRLLGRSTALGVGAASLLFGALINGTASRHLDPTVFRPDLADEPRDDHPGARDPLRRAQPRRAVGVADDAGGAREGRARRAAGGRDRRHRARCARVLARAAAARRRARPRCRCWSECFAIAAGIWAWARERAAPRGRRDRGRRPRNGPRAARHPLARRPTSTRSSSGARSAPRPCATRRRWSTPRSAGSSASGAASSTSRSKGCC